MDANPDYQTPDDSPSVSPDCSGAERMTIVFEVRSREQMKPFYESLMSGQPVLGVVPRSMAWGDQVSIPADIVAAVSELDPFAINEQAVKDLVDVADKFLAR